MTLKDIIRIKEQRKHEQTIKNTSEYIKKQHLKQSGHIIKQREKIQFKQPSTTATKTINQFNVFKKNEDSKLESLFKIKVKELIEGWVGGAFVIINLPAITMLNLTEVFSLR
jgi:hypothetical protein